jgi:FlaA1/EpsC-like NDP-sugar epimerase
MNKRWLKKFILSIVDIISFALSIYIAYIVKFDQLNSKVPTWSFDVILVLACIILVKYLTMLILKMYSKMWRFAGITELIDVIIACTVGAALSMSILFLMSRQPEFSHIVIPRSIMVLAYIFDVALIGGSRFIYRMLFHVSPKEVLKYQLKKRTLIYGAGQAGVMVLKELNSSGYGDFVPVGFMDDDRSKKGQKLHGLTIYGGRDDLEKVAIKEKIQAVIIAMPSASDEDRKAAINAAKETGALVSILPRVHDLIDGVVQVSKIRPVEIEDLLGRSQIKLNNEFVSGYLRGKRVLITGGGGSIGSELCRQIAHYQPACLIILDIYENNAYDIQQELKRNSPELNIKVLIASVRDKDRLDRLFETEKPQVVFHAAAHKHVPLMEDSPEEAIKNNVFGTRNMVELSNAHGVDKFVLISTDKAVNPTNIMGASKRLCEMVVQSFSQRDDVHTEYAAVRFGNVLGSNGSVIPLFKKQILNGGPVTVTHPDVIRFFMTIPEAVQLVVQAGGLAKGGEIFVLDMGSPIKIDTLARDLIRLSGFKPDGEIKIEYTGLRPGEKLFEELLMSEEGLSDTEIDKIFVAKPMTLSYECLIAKIEGLKAYYPDTEGLILKIKEIVPTFKTPDELNEGFESNV